MPDLQHILMNKWHLLQNQPLLRQMFKNPPLISYRKGRSLKDVLVRRPSGVKLRVPTCLYFVLMSLLCFRSTSNGIERSSPSHHPIKRVSMGLTVSRKTAKNLAVWRKNERIFTVSRKKMLAVKKSNHKIRSRDLLLSLMCYAFMCSGSGNYNRNRKCRKCLHNLSHGCRCAS